MRYWPIEVSMGQSNAETRGTADDGAVVKALLQFRIEFLKLKTRAMLERGTNMATALS